MNRHYLILSFLILLVWMVCTEYRIRKLQKWVNYPIGIRHALEEVADKGATLHSVTIVYEEGKPDDPAFIWTPDRLEKLHRCWWGSMSFEECMENCFGVTYTEGKP